MDLRRQVDCAAAHLQTQSLSSFSLQKIIQITNSMSAFLDLPMFDELVSNMKTKKVFYMHRVAVPPVAHSQASDRVALAAESLR